MAVCLVLTIEVYVMVLLLQFVDVGSRSVLGIAGIQLKNSWVRIVSGNNEIDGELVPRKAKKRPNQLGITDLKPIAK